MSTNIHIGKSRDVTFLGSDGSTLPSGALTAESNTPTSATVTVNAANVATVTAVATGGSAVTFSAPGYQPETEIFNVSPLPTLVPTIGPEF